MITFCTWLWTDPEYRWNKHFIYGEQHVRILRDSLRRNCTLPHRFVLITDQPDNFPDIDTVCMPDGHRDLPGYKSKGGGCWHRLRLFDRDFCLTVGERVVQLDLDCVITGNVDPIFDRSEPFVAWKDVTPSTPYCGSMLMMDAGARQRVWDEFSADPKGCMEKSRRKVGTDQAWIGECLGFWEKTWGPKDGVYNYRHELERKHSGRLPENARMVFFTGPVDPSQEQLQRKHQWIAENWREGVT